MRAVASSPTAGGPGNDQGVVTTTRTSNASRPAQTPADTARRVVRLAMAQILVYVGAINVLILFAIMLVNKREDLKAITNLTTRRVVSAGVCSGLLALLVRVVVTTPWSLPGPAAVGEEATARIGEHLFTDYLLPFEVASVLLLMAMIGAIVLARRDVLATDVVTGEVADQGLIEKARTPLLMNRAD